MWDTLIAVLGTLAGGALVAYPQRAADRAARTERHQQEVTGALIALLKAVLKYRESYWLMVASLRDGTGETSDQRADRFRLRTEITLARDLLALVAPGSTLVDLGEKAAWAAIDLSDIPLGAVNNGTFNPATEAALTAGREQSRDTHTALRQAGSAYLSTRSRPRLPTPEPNQLHS
ncbi:hypothetical protein [Streptomyces sp. NPDC088261]|uniref:hypothetical protein n=1 Tax=Streptomyces sp. NPDC088261 TaxID=3365851 RepID=UPI0037FB3B66